MQFSAEDLTAAQISSPIDGRISRSDAMRQSTDLVSGVNPAALIRRQNHGRREDRTCNFCYQQFRTHSEMTRHMHNQHGHSERIRREEASGKYEAQDLLEWHKNAPYIAGTFQELEYSEQRRMYKSRTLDHEREIARSWRALPSTKDYFLPTPDSIIDEPQSNTVGNTRRFPRTSIMASKTIGSFEGMDPDSIYSDSPRQIKHTSFMEMQSPGKGLQAVRNLAPNVNEGVLWSYLEDSLAKPAQRLHETSLDLPSKGPVQREQGDPNMSPTLTDVTFASILANVSDTTSPRTRDMMSGTPSQSETYCEVTQLPSHPPIVGSSQNDSAANVLKIEEFIDVAAESDSTEISHYVPNSPQYNFETLTTTPESANQLLVEQNPFVRRLKQLQTEVADLDDDSDSESTSELSCECDSITSDQAETYGNTDHQETQQNPGFSTHGSGRTFEDTGSCSGKTSDRSFSSLSDEQTEACRSRNDLPVGWQGSKDSDHTKLALSERQGAQGDSTVLPCPLRSKKFNCHGKSKSMADLA